MTAGKREVSKVVVRCRGGQGYRRPTRVTSLFPHTRGTQPQCYSRESQAEGGEKWMNSRRAPVGLQQQQKLPLRNSRQNTKRLRWRTITGAHTHTQTSTHAWTNTHASPQRQQANVMCWWSWSVEKKEKVIRSCATFSSARLQPITLPKCSHITFKSKMV